jgi:hypothetical protein
VGRVSSLDARASTLTAHGHSYPLRDAPLFTPANRGPCGTRHIHARRRNRAPKLACHPDQIQMRLPYEFQALPPPPPTTLVVVRPAQTASSTRAAAAAGPRPPRALQAPSRTLSLAPRPPQHAVRACSNARRLHLHTRATGPAFLLMPAERVQRHLCRTGWRDAQRSTEACSNT